MLMLALKLILNDKGGKQHCFYHLLILTWVLRYSWTRGTIRKKSIEAPLYTLYWVFKEIICKACQLCNCFLVIKGILKAFFSFIPWLLNFSALPNYGWNSRKKYTLRLLSKCQVRSALLPIGCKVPSNSTIPSSFPLDGLLLA